jgi:hypothetical protein
MVPIKHVKSEQLPLEPAGVYVPMPQGEQVVFESESVSLVPGAHWNEEHGPNDFAGTNRPPPGQLIQAVSGLES